MVIKASLFSLLNIHVLSQIERVVLSHKYEEKRIFDTQNFRDKLNHCYISGDKGFIDRLITQLSLIRVRFVTFLNLVLREALIHIISGLIAYWLSRLCF